MLLDLKGQRHLCSDEATRLSVPAHTASGAPNSRLFSGFHEDANTATATDNTRGCFTVRLVALPCGGATASAGKMLIREHCHTHHWSQTTCLSPSSREFRLSFNHQGRSGHALGFLKMLRKVAGSRDACSNSAAEASAGQWESLSRKSFVFFSIFVFDFLFHFFNVFHFFEKNCASKKQSRKNIMKRNVVATPTNQSFRVCEVDLVCFQVTCQQPCMMS